MRSRTIRTMLVLALIGSASFANEILEDFESLAWPSGPWFTADGPSSSTATGAVHDGQRGIIGSGGWEIMGGTSPASFEYYSLWVRHSTGQGSAGRVYLGFGAIVGGAHSLVFAPNTSQIIVQDNTAWGFSDLASSPAAIAADQWYRLELEMQSTAVVGRLFEADGFTPVATVSYNFFAPVPAGDFALRVVGSGMQADTLQRMVDGEATDVCTYMAQDFESLLWPVFPWVTADGAAGSTTAGAAHTGARGFESNGGWALEPGFNFGLPGNKLSLWVRQSTALGPPGRVYLGFQADAGGCRSFVYAPNSNEIIYQSNPAWGFVDLINDPIPPAVPDQWYRMELEMTAPDAMVMRLYDTDGTSLIQSISIGGSITDYMGGIAIRTFGGMQADTLEFFGPPLLEGFDAPWPAAGWSVATGGAGTTTGAARHNGSRGYRNATDGWEFNDTVTIGLPGQRLSAWTSGTGGRVYLGFDAGAAGCLSFVLARNTNSIIFQDNAGWAFSDIVSSPFEDFSSTWYRMEVEFVNGFDVVGRVYAPNGATCLARLDATIPGGYSPGGIAIRTFGTNDLDTIENTDPGASCGCATFCGDCNHNGVGPDILDALTAARFAAGINLPTPDDVVCCDTNNGGAIEITDALMMAQAATGIPVILACP